MKNKKYTPSFYVIIAIVLLFTAFSSCNSKKCECPISAKDLKYNDSLLSKLKPELFKWFDEYNELPLYRSDLESYRLTVSASLDNFAKIYQLENRDGEYFLIIKEFSRHKDCKDTTELFSEKEISVTQKEWDDFVFEINKNCFWTLPIIKKNGCLDGTGHTLEGNLGENYCTESTYHIVYRNCYREPQFNILCEEFYKFELLNYRNIYEYDEYGDGIYEFENDSLSIKVSFDEFAYGDTLSANYGDDLFVNFYLIAHNIVLFDSVFYAKYLDMPKIGNSKKYDPEKKHRYTTLYEFSDAHKSIEVAKVDECNGILGLKIRFKDTTLAPIEVVLKE